MEVREGGSDGRMEEGMVSEGRKREERREKERGREELKSGHPTKWGISAMSGIW